MRGAVETLRENSFFVFLGVYDSIDDLTAPAVGGPVVLLVDPFGDPGAGLCDLAWLHKPYAALIISAHTHVDSVRHALRTGARGFIGKEAGSPMLLDAVSAVGFGGIYLGSLLDGMLGDHLDSAAEPSPTTACGLTSRERDVVAMVAKGLTHKQIGTKLSLSKATIDTYVHRVRQKVGSGNKADLTRLAFDLGLVKGNMASTSSVGTTDNA